MKKYKAQIYVGTTSFSEDELFSYFEFNKVNEDDDAISQHMIDMGLDYYDEDNLLVEFHKDSSLQFILDKIKWYISLDVSNNDLNKFKHIDFIVVINSSDGFTTPPEKHIFKNGLMNIEYLGEKEFVYNS